MNQLKEAKSEREGKLKHQPVKYKDTEFEEQSQLIALRR